MSGIFVLTFLQVKYVLELSFRYLVSGHEWTGCPHGGKMQEIVSSRQYIGQQIYEPGSSNTTEVEQGANDTTSCQTHTLQMP